MAVLIEPVIFHLRRGFYLNGASLNAFENALILQPSTEPFIPLSGDKTRVERAVLGRGPVRLRAEVYNWMIPR